MKMKLFSYICALTLVFSTLSSMVVAEAASAPSYKFSVNFTELDGVELSDENYDEDWNWEAYFGAKVYKAEVTIEGPAKKSKVDGNFVGCLVNTIQCEYNYTSSKKLAIVKTESALAGAVVPASNPGELSETGTMTVAWGSTTPIKETTVIATYYFIAEDMGSIDDIVIDCNEDFLWKVIAEFYDGTSNVSTEYKEISTYLEDDITVTGYGETAGDDDDDTAVLEDVAGLTGDLAKYNDGYLMQKIVKADLTEVSTAKKIQVSSIDKPAETQVMERTLADALGLTGETTTVDISKLVVVVMVSEAKAGDYAQGFDFSLVD